MKSLTFNDRSLHLGAVTLMVLASTIAALVYQQDIHLYQTQQRQQTQILARNTAASIDYTLSRHATVLRAFASDHHQALTELVRAPENTALQHDLRKRLQRYMPGLFGFSIVDGRTGRFILQDDLFEGFIDQVCVSDIRKLIETGRHPVRVHPNPIRYHYDLVVPAQLGGKPYYLFASYTLTPFITLLKNHQIPGHSLYIVRRSPQGWLIEMTADHDRLNLFNAHKPVFLSPDLTAEAVFAPIPGTLWQVASVVDRQRLIDFKRKSAVHVLAFWGFITLTIVVLTLMLQQRLRQIRRQQLQLNEALRALQEKSDQLALQAKTDGLTGLANRRAFDEALRREWYRGARNQTPLSLIMIDIDHFKRWNDTLGHLAGDDILRSVAATLRQQVKRQTDLVARYGGEELAVLLPETPHDAACALAERIRQAVEALDKKNVTVPNGHLTVSIGVCTCIPDPDLPPDTTLIACADEALYRTKEGGRNRVECNHPPKCQDAEQSSTAQSE
ncbi:diguanylate cyclase (GGDEF) domain-containing protein [Sulfurivirga caldicuralii]|uniref:diguanylate cyclase n=1 Tax=Sulfurivirga caldicuralii TaxID=364032 RepID=A0A1N6DJB2_9GAMM|nr:sensor domain-containing diguanylate cyclase [Sulfurivirga caldicuralii]SIN70807.1 diguanylate cyclase (GGDEF) domain-containing protein [Sulfurivirga caldicuralii]